MTESKWGSKCVNVLRSWKKVALHEHSHFCLFSCTYFLCFFHQGCHVKTGQLAAIKVMDVTGVRHTYMHFGICSHTHTYPHTEYHLKWLYQCWACHLIMSDESVLVCVCVSVCMCTCVRLMWQRGNEDRPIAMVILAGSIRTAVWSQACL